MVEYLHGDGAQAGIDPHSSVPGGHRTHADQLQHQLALPRQLTDQQRVKRHPGE